MSFFCSGSLLNIAFCYVCSHLERPLILTWMLPRPNKNRVESALFEFIEKHIKVEFNVFENVFFPWKPWQELGFKSTSAILYLGGSGRWSTCLTLWLMDKHCSFQHLLLLVTSTIILVLYLHFGVNDVHWFSAWWVGGLLIESIYFSCDYFFQVDDSNFLKELLVNLQHFPLLPQIILD